MLVLQVQVVTFWVRSRVATLLAHVDLVASLFVRVVVCDPVYLQGVRLQRTSLGEGLVTVIAFVGSHACSQGEDVTRAAGDAGTRQVLTCMCARVSLQVEGVVEALATEGTEVAFDVRVAFEVTVQEARQTELLATDLTLERIVARGRGLTGTRSPRTHQFVWLRTVLFLGTGVAAIIAQERVFDAVASIHELD